MRLFILAIFTYIALNGCGGTIHVEGQVNQVVQVDFNSVNSYFKNLCEQQNVTDVTSCTNTYTTDFWSTVFHTGEIK